MESETLSGVCFLFDNHFPAVVAVDYDIVAPSHWRSVLGGSWGRKRDEQKQHAIEYVKDVLDKDVSSDEADALCIGLSFIKEDNSAW